MLPVPPELGSRVRATNAAKLFQAVKHGIKFTGMPAWPSQQRDDEVWAMVAFLLRYPELDAPAYRRLAGRHLVASPLPVELTLGAPPAPATAQACMKCHGADGLGRDNPSMPRLAGQRAEYMAEALAAYASGKRRSGTMAVVAAELTPTARTELSRYFAQLPASPRPNSPAPQAAAATEAASLARGERLARHGVPSERVPACIECHDPAARRGKAEFPLLAGQPAAYLETQLALFRADHRGGADHAHLMQPIAARLTEEQARDVARYFASLPPRAALSPDASGADETRP
jgi:cytochrome c553